MEYQHITHQDFVPFIQKDSQILILGSLPSIGSRKAKFYYAYKTNRFFKVLAILFNEEEPISVDDRKDFLKRHQIALFDVIQECDIKGSSDSSIRNVIVNDIPSLIKGTNIKQVFTTGKTGTDLYHQHIGKDNIYLPSPSAANASMSLDDLVREYRIILRFNSHNNK